MAAPCGVFQHIGQDHHQEHHEDNTQRENRAANLYLGAQKLEQRRIGGDVLTADGFIGRVKEIGRQNDLPHAQCHNEGRQLHAGDQPAVQRANRRPEGKATGNGNDGRQAVAKSELPHDHGGNHRDGPHAQINARRQDDKGLRRRNDANDLNLLQDQRQGKGREELVAKHRAKDGNRSHQDDQRHQRGRCVQRVVEAADQPAALVLEGCDFGGGIGRRSFEIVRPGHVFPPRKS